MSGKPASATIASSCRYSACAHPSGAAEPLARPVYSPRAGRSGPSQICSESISPGPAQAVADQLEKLGSDRALGGTAIRITGQAQVLAGGGAAPGLDAVVPVVGHRTQMGGGDVLTRVARELGRRDQSRDARRQG